MEGYDDLTAPYGEGAFPSLDDCYKNPNKVLAYRNRTYNKLAAYRRRLEARWAVNFQYLIDNQWLDFVASQALANSALQSYSLRFLQGSPDGMPRPVTNILAPNIDIALATIAKRKYMPKPVSVGSDPWDTENVRHMANVLRTKAINENWSNARQRFALYMFAAGTAGMRAWWDQDFTESEDVASPFAIQCLNCKQVVADSIFPLGSQGAVRYNSGSISRVENDPYHLELTNCPNCDQTGTLVAAELNELDRDKTDVFGRRVFIKVPRGKPAFEALDPFALYPENGGVFVAYDTWRAMHTVTARTVDWVTDRHPDFRDKIKPDSQTEVLRRNPLLGEFSSFAWFGSAIDSNICTNHVLYYEMFTLPGGRFPKGAIIRSCNNLILEAIPLMWDYVDVKSGFKVSAPRLSVACGVWRERPGEFHGHGMIDRGRSVQNRLNGRDAQVVDIHERMANPHVGAANDMNLTGPEWIEGRYSGKRLRWDRSPMAPDDRPIVFGGVSPPAGVWQERDRIMQDTRFILGPAEVEQGAPPKNISTTSGLQLQSENAELRRGPDEDMIDFVSRVTWTAIMKMEQAFRVYPSSYEEADTEDAQRWRTVVYDRNFLRGTFRMEIEKAAFVSKSIYDREASREAQADQLYVVTKPVHRKKLLEQRGLPTDVNQDEFYQIDCANQKWRAFLQNGIVPPLDVTIDNPAIHFDVFGTELLSDDGKRLAKLAKWSLIVPLLTDWETLLKQRMQFDEQTRAFYGMWTPFEEMVQKHRELTAQFQEDMAAFPQAIAEYDAHAQAAQATNTPPQMMPPIKPVEPPPVVILPRPLNLKILTVWSELLDIGGWVMPAEEQETIDGFLRFRAVYESYRLIVTWGGTTPPLVPGMAPAAPGSPAAAPGTPEAAGANVGMAPPEAPNPANPTNSVTPGTSAAVANANAAGGA